MPSASVNYIIGAGGRNIELLRKRHHAEFRFREYEWSMWSLVTVTCPSSACDSCLEDITALASVEALSEAKVCRLTATVPASVLKREDICELKRRYCAQMIFPSEAPLSYDDVDIIVTSKSRASARGFLDELLFASTAPSGPSLVTVLVSVSTAFVGLIIGRGGVTIHGLRSRYQARIVLRAAEPQRTNISVTCSDFEAVAACTRELGSLAKGTLRFKSKCMPGLGLSSQHMQKRVSRLPTPTPASVGVKQYSFGEAISCFRLLSSCSYLKQPQRSLSW